jgi:hypothetical protein
MTQRAYVSTKAKQEPVASTATAVEPCRSADAVHDTEEPAGRSSTAGKAMPSALKGAMERAFGHDFSKIRVWESEQPRSFGAAAFTHGNHLHFTPGRYRPNSREGRALIGHELAHVVQQRAGRVAPPQAKGSPVNADPRLEAEADKAGERAARGVPVTMPRGTPAGGADLRSSHFPGSVPGCGCPTCHGPIGASDQTPAAGPMSANNPSASIQLGGCERCGSNKHKTNACPVENWKIRQHNQEAKEFNQKKQQTLETLKSRSTAATEAFKGKHVASKGTSLGKASTNVASTRKWGGGNTSGRSTVAAMSKEDLAKEAQFQVESLKMSEADVTDEGISAKFGVNKPTRFYYPTKSATVRSDRQGKRTITEDKDKVAQPVLGLKGTDIHHLEGVKEKDEDE